MKPTCAQCHSPFTAHYDVVHTQDKGRVGHKEEWDTGLKVTWNMQSTECDCTEIFATTEQRANNVIQYKKARAITSS